MSEYRRLPSWLTEEGSINATEEEEATPPRAAANGGSGGTRAGLVWPVADLHVD